MGILSQTKYISCHGGDMYFTAKEMGICHEEIHIFVGKEYTSCHEKISILSQRKYVSGYEENTYLVTRRYISCSHRPLFIVDPIKYFDVWMVVLSDVQRQIIILRGR
jgi:hypothetical protein